MHKPYEIKDYLSEEKYNLFVETSETLQSLTKEVVEKNKAESVSASEDDDAKASAYTETLRAFLSSKEIMGSITVINELSAEADKNFIDSFNGDNAEIYSSMLKYFDSLSDEELGEIARSYRGSAEYVLKQFENEPQREQQLKLFAHNFIATAQALSFYVRALLDTDHEDVMSDAIAKYTNLIFENDYVFSFTDIEYKGLLDESFKNTKTIGDVLEERKKEKVTRKKREKKTLDQNRQLLEEIEESPLSAPKDFYNFPNSPAVYMMMTALTSGSNINELAEKRKDVSHGTSIKVEVKRKMRIVTSESESGKVTLEISDIGKLTNGNKPAKKLVTHCLIKANEQALYNGELTKRYITFPIQELIDLGMYSSVRSARTAIENGMGVLTSFKVKGTSQKGKNKEIVQSSLRVLFTGYDIEKNQCRVYLNQDMNWGFIAQYFSIIPKYYYVLSNKASDLLFNIFYLARQHTKDITTKGYFDISFRSIQASLFLPSEKNTKNPQRDIKDVIDDAVAEIEKEHGNQFGSESGELEFSLLQMYEEGSTITEFLDNGHLRVFFKGKFAESFLLMQKKTEKRIESSKKKSEAIKEKALAMNLAKKMESDKKQH